MNEYRDFIVGLKVRMSKSVVLDSGIEPLRIARGLSEETSLPLMVHIGSALQALKKSFHFRKRRCNHSLS